MNTAPVLTVTGAPNTMAATTRNATAANHIWIDLERVIGLGMLFTWIRYEALTPWISVRGRRLATCPQWDSDRSGIAPIVYRPVRAVPPISQGTLAEMVGTTRSRVDFFMKKFQRLGFIDYAHGLKVNNSLLTVVLHD
jgi:hypothetical protein